MTFGPAFSRERGPKKVQKRANQASLKAEGERRVRRLRLRRRERIVGRR